MQNLVANLTGKVRQASYGGKPYLVAPITLLVPGVLNGSKGPIYYPPDEIEESAERWEGIPILLNHPYTENGQPTTAENRQEQRLGHLQSVRYDNDKLVAEGWFDEELTRQRSELLWNNLLLGKPVEVSTGLQLDTIPSPSEYDGVSYSHTTHDYRPDHLAVLLEQQGACSLKQGCGIFNKENEMDKAKLVSEIIANSACWQDSDKETLADLAEDRLKELHGRVMADSKARKAQETTLNSATQEWTDSLGTKHTWNAEKGVWESEPKKEENVENSNKGENTSKPLTEEEWLANAPESIRQTIENAKRTERKQKEALVEKLVANVAEADKEAQTKRLLQRSLADLESDVALLPKTPEKKADYVGAGATLNSSKKEYPAFGLPGEYLDDND